jgi:hypothetical protein
MRLTEPQCRQTLLKRGVYLRDACDECKTLIHYANRFTRREGLSGVWCSRECRDGALAFEPGCCKSCRTALTGRRKGARFCSDVCRKRQASQDR